MARKKNSMLIIFFTIDTDWHCVQLHACSCDSCHISYAVYIFNDLLPILNREFYTDCRIVSKIAM